MHNASDMLSDTLCMEFASTLKNKCVMKLDTASCSLLMTAFTQARSFDFKGDNLKTDVNHIYVMVSRDATREGQIL